MHGKFYLGLGLLLICVIGCLWIGHGVGKTQDAVSQYVEQAADQALPGGVAALKQAKKIWSNQQNKLAAVSNHGPIDEIEALFSKAIRSGETGQKEVFLTLCDQLKLALESLASDHRLTWWNFLSILAIE